MPDSSQPGKSSRSPDGERGESAGVPDEATPATEPIHPVVAPARPASPVASSVPAAPAGKRLSRKLLGIGAAILVLAIGLPIAAVLVLAAIVDRPTEASAEPASAKESAAATPSASATPTVLGEPGDQMEALRQEFRAAAQSELGSSWVTQISSKRDGLEVDGKTWDEAAILKEYEDYRSRYPNAILLWSGDWSTYERNDFWVIVLNASHSDPEQALEVCRSDGFARDDCAAKWLSETDDPEGSTRFPDE